jgi:hypothetical protein
MANNPALQKISKEFLHTTEKDKHNNGNMGKNKFY